MILCYFMPLVIYQVNAFAGCFQYRTIFCTINCFCFIFRMEATLHVPYHRFTSSPVFNRISLGVSEMGYYGIPDTNVLFMLSVCYFVPYYSDRSNF